MLEDSKSRTPVDLLSGPVVQVVGNGNNSGTYCCVLKFFIMDFIVFSFELIVIA